VANTAVVGVVAGPLAATGGRTPHPRPCLSHYVCGYIWEVRTLQRVGEHTTLRLVHDIWYGGVDGDDGVAGEHLIRVHACYTVVTGLLHCCYIVVTHFALLSHWCYKVVRLLLH
jgi:hypothetical protein